MKPDIRTQRDSKNGSVPASTAQSRIRSIEGSRPRDPALHIAAAFELTGELNLPALERALNEAVSRHEVLRSRFETSDERLIRTVMASHPRIDLSLTELAALGGGSQSAEVDRWTEMVVHEPFQLESGPLVRARILRLGSVRHILLICVHRLVCDRWSLGVLADELGVLYEAVISGRIASLTEADNGVPLADSDSKVDSTVELARFELLPDFGRTAQTNPRAAIMLRQLPQVLVEPIGARIAAVLGLLLARYTGETRIAIGIGTVGRRTGFESAVGPFETDSALLLNAAGDPSFAEFERRTDEALPRMTPDVAPRIRFIEQPDPLSGWTQAGLRLEPLPPVSAGALYDLDFRLTRTGLYCEYNVELYRRDTIEALLEHFELLWAAVAREPDRKLSEFTFLTPREEHRLLVEWNATQADYNREICVHQLLEESAQRTPNAIAVEFEKRKVTFAELEGRANRLAHYLAERGARPGWLMGICLERSIEMVTAVLAVLKTGAAYVPLDPAFPASRLEFMAMDSGIQIVVTSEALNDVVKAGAAAVVLLDAEAALIERMSSSPLGRLVDAESNAYVLYTSGSTGKPKGVEVRHRSVVNLLYAMQSHVQLESTGALLAVTTLSFDIAALELFLPMLAGARTVLASREQTSDPRALRGLIEQSKPTLIQATPGTWRMLADAGWKGSQHLKALVGGEKVSREVANLLLERCCAVWNCYGPTETTVWSTICRLEKESSPISIGRPLANTQVYVLDPNQRLLPIGAAGELYIGGDGVARGYLNRPALTAERFVPNPFGDGLLYKTGDIVRYWPDGRLQILGRNDGQVKIRGFRIELGDVEAALSSCPGVRAAAVVAREASSESVLAGYFVPGDGMTAAEVRTSLAARVPGYMVPPVLTALEVLPVTPNGKIDRKALEAYERIETAPSDASAAPMRSTDALETTLIGIWEPVLGVRPIRPSDNFFELGGESVMAARIFVRMESILGKSLPLATLFQAPTVEKLAAVIRRREWKPMWSSLVPIQPGGDKPPFFFVHPIGGNVLNFSGFCGHFGPDQPIYGLQARGLNNEVSPHTSIEEMAEDYIEGIRSVQPDGPYYIGGFSAGGVVAFEMARQLNAAAQPVGILALLDTEILTLVQDNVSLEARLNHWWRLVKMNLRYASRMSLLEYAGKKSFNLRMRAKLFAWAARERIGLAIDASTLNVEEAFLLAFKRYVPQPYYGDATLFRAGNGAEYLDARLGWGDIIRGRLDIEEVSGDHDTILQEPHIGMLAGLLESCLEKANGNDIHRPRLTPATGEGGRMAGLTPAIDLGKP